jgi:N-acetylmuramoyl-L-alanine amidase
MSALGISTDSEVEVFVPVRGLPWEEEKEKKTVCISSGHGLKIRGASGVIDEVDEARKVVPRVAEYLAQLGCEVFEFHDDVSTTQQENLERICDYHNAQVRDLDVSVHFNAYNGSANGTECLYVSQEELAERVSSLIADASGMFDRGPKYNSDLYFLNHTNEPAILVEVGFCDSEIDAQLYQDNFEDVCKAIAKAIADA